MQREESWRDIPINGYENKYVCSNFGQVKIKANSSILEYKDKISGRYVELETIDKKWYDYNLGYLVLLSFVSEQPEKHKIHHKDGNIYNCNLHNLAYVLIKDTVEYKLTEDELKNEEWRDYKDYNYRVSNMGRILGKNSKEYIQPRMTSKNNGNSRFQVNLHRTDKINNLCVDGIVTFAFYGPMKENQKIHYKDGDYTNLRLSNLVYIDIIVSITKI
jgi:hypothetical protein